MFDTIYRLHQIKSQKIKFQNLIIPLDYSEFDSGTIFVYMQSNKDINEEQKQDGHRGLYNGVIVYVGLYDKQGILIGKHPVLTFDKTSIIIAGSIRI